MHFLLSAMASISLLSLARSAELTSRAFSGKATFYTGNLHGGACSFSTYTLPTGVFGTALSDSNWDNAGNCGACVSVTGPDGNSITAMIVDECPGCGPNHLDLFPDAFQELANPTKGVIPITWDFVECPVSGPLQLHNKDGVSKYWFSMQVVNTKRAVLSLEVSTDAGKTWQGTTRQSYNFYQYSSGFGTNTVDVKVTSVNGDVVIVQNVEVASDSSTTALSNFGSSDSSGSGAVVSVDVSALSSPTSETTPTQAAVISTIPVPTSTESTEMPGNFLQSSSPTSDAVSAPSNYFTCSTSTATSLAMTTISASAMSTYVTPSVDITSLSTVTITVPCSSSTSSSVAPPPAPTTIRTTASAKATTIVPTLTTMATPTPTPSHFTGGAIRTYGSVAAAAAMAFVAMML